MLGKYEHAGMPPQLARRIETNVQNLSVAPEVQKLYEEIYDLVVSLTELNKEQAYPAINNFRTKHPDIFVATRFGIIKRFRELSTQILIAAQPYKDNLAVPKQEKAVDSTTKTLSNKEIVQLANQAADIEKEYFADWLKNDIKQNSDLGKFLLEEYQTTNPANVLFALSEKLQTEQRDFLTSEEFALLVDLFLVIVKDEVKKNAQLPTAPKLNKELLSKILTEVAASNHLELNFSEIDTLSLTHVFSKEGASVLVLFRAFFRQLPDVLINIEDPNHKAVAELTSVLNKFSQDIKDVPKPLKSKPFFLHLAARWIIRDTEQHNFNFYYMLSKADQLNREFGKEFPFYRDFVNHLVETARFLGNKFVITEDELMSELFSAEIEEPEVVNEDTFLQLESLMQQLDKNEHSISQAYLSKEFPHELNIKSDIFVINMKIFYESEGMFVIETTILFSKEEEVKKDKRGDVQYDAIRRFSFRTEVFRDQAPIFYLPLLYGEGFSAETIAALEHFCSQMISQEHQRVFSQEQPLSGKEIRQKRKAQYVPKEKTEPVEKEVPVTQPQSGEDRENENDAEGLARLLPSTLEISPRLAREIAAAYNNKKGTAAIQINADNFIATYNLTINKTEKKGKGHPLRGVKGPKGENIWRFQLDYSNRLLAVEIDAETALAFTADDHDDSYTQNVTSLAETALREYYANKKGE